MRTPKITNHSLLTEMPKLKSLELAQVDLLDNSCLRAVMQSSKNIQFIMVVICPNVSRERLIEDAMRITENRKSNVMLRIAFWDGISQYTLDGRYTNVSPYLQIR